MGSPSKPNAEVASAKATTIEFLSPPRASVFPSEWYGISSVRHFWFEWRLRATLALFETVGLDRTSPRRVLDVGGGSGLLRDQIEAHTAWIVDVTDLNLEALQNARQGRGKILYYDVLQRETTLEAAFDIVLLFDVLEHVEATRALLEAIAHHLRSDGLLLVNVPASPWLYSAYDRAAGHLRRYDAKRLRQEFAGLEYEVVCIRSWGMSLTPVAVLRRLLLGRTPNERTIRSGFDPGTRLTHAVLRGMMRLETSLILRPPFGSSILLAARRS